MSASREPLATTKITFADGYEINCPNKFLDPDGLTIMELPVVVKDVEHTKHTFNAAGLIRHLSTNPTLPRQAIRAYVTHRDVMDENDELQNENTIALTVDKDLEDERREFFKSLLKTDKALLNDGKHNTALARVQELADGIDPDKRKKLQKPAAEKGILILGNDFGHVDYQSRPDGLLIGFAQEMGQIEVDIPLADLKQSAINERNKRRMRAAAVGTSTATFTALVAMFNQGEQDLSNVDLNTVILPVVAASLAAMGIETTLEHFMPSIFRQTRTMAGATLTAAATGVGIFGTQYALSQKDNVQPEAAKAIAASIGVAAIPVVSGLSYYANNIHNWWYGKKQPADAIAAVETVKPRTGPAAAKV